MSRRKRLRLGGIFEVEGEEEKKEGRAGGKVGKWAWAKEGKTEGKEHGGGNKKQHDKNTAPNKLDAAVR